MEVSGINRKVAIMKKIDHGILFSLLVILSSVCDGQALFMPAGGRSAGIAHASVLLRDPWGAVNNPAGLTLTGKFAAGMHGENRFMLREVGYMACFAAFTVKSGLFGFALGRQGYSAYNESMASVSFKKDLGKSVSAGIRLEYIFIRSGREDFRKEGAISCDLGFISFITSELSIGIHLLHPVIFHTGNHSFSIRSSVFKVATGYSFSDKARLIFQAEKDLYSKMVLKAGTEYALTPWLFIRTGLSSGPLQLSFGFGYQRRFLCVDISAIMHQHLGWYPQCSIHFQSK